MSINIKTGEKITIDSTLKEKSDALREAFYKMKIYEEIVDELKSLMGLDVIKAYNNGEKKLEGFWDIMPGKRTLDKKLFTKEASFETKAEYKALLKVKKVLEAPFMKQGKPFIKIGKF